MKYLTPGVSWATDATYPAGPNPWNIAPNNLTKIQPSLGLQAGGAAPNVQVSAQEFNWLMNNRQQAVDVQTHNALQNWRYGALPVSGMLGNTQIVHVPVAALKQRATFIFEIDDTHSNNTWWSRSNGGYLWLSKVGMSPTFANLTDAAPGAAGEIMLVIASPQYQYSTNYGSSWTNQSVGSSNTLSAHFGLGKYWLCQRADIYVASSISTLVSGTHPAIPIPGGGSFTGVPEFADDGVGTICLVANATGGTAPTYPSVYVSTNLGATWTKVFDLTGAVLANLKYSPLLGLFVTWDNTGSVSTSPDGVNWTRGTTVTGSSTAGLATGARTFAIVGSAIVKAFNAFFGGGEITGVAYSFDLGASWYVHAFGSSSLVIKQIRAANNRIYATDGFGLWVSEILGANDKDF